MGTTSLTVELVIIGFQVTAWISLLLLSIWGYNWIDLMKLRDWSGVIAVGLIGISYTLGIVFDSIVAPFFGYWSYSVSQKIVKVMNRREEEDVGPFKYESPAKMQAYIVATNPDLSETLERLSNQSKLVRATSVNLSLISIATIVFVATRIGFTWQSVLTVLLVSVPLILVCISAWHRTYRSFYFELALIYTSLKQREKSASK